jgi:hypothetical protein
MLDEVQQTTSMRNMKIDQVPKKSQGESLIYWGDYLYVKNCMRNWEIWAICTCPPTGVTIQDNENLPNNEKQSSATLPGSFQVPGSGDPFFSRCFFLSTISRPFSLFWRLFCIGATHGLLLIWAFGPDVCCVFRSWTCYRGMRMNELESLTSLCSTYLYVRGSRSQGNASN